MIKIDAKAPEGNAFGIMATVGNVMRQLGKDKEERDAAMERMMSGDYANLCAVAKQATGGLVVVVNTDNEEDEDED